MIRTHVFVFSILCLFVATTAHAQNYKILVSEDFGTGTADPSATPSTNIAPGTTSYTSQAVRTTLSDGFYAVAKNPQGYDDFGNITSAWQHGGDHTTGSGYMMLINANPLKQGEANGSYYLYSSSVFDIPGATYVIDFWGANLIHYNMTNKYPNLTFKDAYVGLSVRNTPNATGTLYNTTGTNQWILPRATGTQNTMPWVNRSVTFTLPVSYNSSALYFNFYNTDVNSSTYGNDLAIDDITIKMQVITLSGNVFNDANGNTVINTGEPAINGVTTPLYAYLTKSNGTIVSKVQVQADGTYTFSGDQGVPYANSNIGLKVMVSAQNINAGSVINTPVPPDGYGYTGENVNGTTATAGTADGIITLTTTATDMANLNFGMEKLPVSASVTTTIPTPSVGQVIKLNGVDGNPPVPSATDPEDGPLGSGKTIVITQLPANSTLVYNGSNVTAGQSISAFDPSLLTIKITTATKAATSTSFKFDYKDAAGKQGATPATYTLNWSTPLPVKLTTFNAEKDNGIARLSWTTASETNSRGFSVERSNDGSNWETILFTASKSENGNSTMQLNYAASDDAPLKGTNYYRLKLMDLDGQYSLSQVRVLNFEQENMVSVYPNPATDRLTINTQSTNTINTTHIIDMQGRILVQTAGQNSIDVKALPAGRYIIQIALRNKEQYSFPVDKR